MPLTRFSKGNLLSLIMFDLDGTLVDSAPGLTAAANKMLGDLGILCMDQQAVTGCIGNGTSYLVQQVLLEATAISKAGDLDQQFLSEAVSLFEEAYSSLCSFNCTLYPGVAECLETLRELGISIAVVTNKPEKFAQLLISELDLSDAVDFIVCGDSLPKKKPDALPLNHCLEHFSVSGSNALMVGDSYYDIASARAALVPVVAVSYGYNSAESLNEYAPDFLIDSITELASKLDINFLA